MRRSKKNECLKQLDGLKNMIKSLVGMPQDTKLDVLQTAQESAICLGNTIEEYEGGGHPVVELLEAVCELIYESYCSGQDDKGRLYQKVLQVEKKILKDIKEEPEIAFMPVGAEDWSHMAGIWKAAVDTLGCYVSVVPVPVKIFDTEWGLPKIQCYTGNYPDEVPLTDYREYDLSLYRPDIIFVSGLAKGDDFCRVSEAFSLDNLESFAGRVVCIPDNITVSWLDKGKKDTEDNIRSTLLDEWNQRRDVIRLNGQKEQRFKDKKVFLLETGIYNVLHASEIYISELEKVVDAIGMFKNAILWWRPHPLTVYALNRHGKETINRYQELLEHIRDKPYVVVDDTPDLVNAVCMADAYIGELSNGLALSGLEGYPSYICTPFDEKTEPGYIQPSAAAVWRNKLYLSAKAFNGLFCLDLDMDRLEYIGPFGGEEYHIKGLHSLAAVYKGNIYFIPGRGKAIARLNTETLDINLLPLPENVDSAGRLKFNGVVITGKELWALPGDGGVILKLDMETLEMATFDRWPGRLDFSRIPFKGGAVAGNRLWLCPYNSQDLVYMDLYSGKMKAIPWELPEQSLCGIAAEGNMLWFCPQKGDAVLKVDAITTECDYIEHFPDSFWKAEDRYSSIVYQNHAMWLVPYHARSVLRIDTGTGRVTETDEFPEDFRFFNPGCRDGYFSGSVKDEDRIYLLSSYANAVLVIDTKTESTSCYHLQISREMFNKLILPVETFDESRDTQLEKYMDISDNINLERFLEDVCTEIKTESMLEKQWFKDELYQSHGLTGGKIWNELWKK